MHSIVVSGTLIKMTIDQYEPLWAVIAPALRLAGIQPGLNVHWRFSDEQGNELDSDKTPSALDLKGGDSLIFLSMEAGIAASSFGSEVPDVEG